MRFLVMGAGGIGGFFGAMLANAGEDVWFVARGPHYEAMKQHGLQIVSTVGSFTVPPATIVQDPSSVGQTDIVLFCVKSYDTESAAEQLTEVVDEKSLVISLQNGVDNVEKISRHIPRTKVYGGAAYISSRITAPGQITEVGSFQRIVFGPMGRAAHPSAEDVHARLVRAGIKCTLVDDIRMELWRKLIFIASMGSLTALSRLNHGDIVRNPQTRALMFDAMREVQAVAVKQGVSVEPVDEPRVLEGLKRFSDDTRSSMYFDLMSERPMEIEALNGTVVRLGEQLGIPTPIHRMIYAVLLPYHLRHAEQHAAERPGKPAST
jgi:2-dehydropantoate 2-reductase